MLLHDVRELAPHHPVEGRTARLARKGLVAVARASLSNAEAADAPSLVVTFCHTKDELEMPLLDLKFR